MGPFVYWVESLRSLPIQAMLWSSVRDQPIPQNREQEGFSWKQGWAPVLSVYSMMPMPSIKLYIAAIRFQSRFLELVSMTLQGPFQLGMTYDMIPFSSQHVVGSPSAGAQLAEISFSNKWWYQGVGSSAHQCLRWGISWGWGLMEIRMRNRAVRWAGRIDGV